MVVYCWMWSTCSLWLPRLLGAFHAPSTQASIASATRRVVQAQGNPLSLSGGRSPGDGGRTWRAAVDCRISRTLPRTDDQLSDAPREGADTDHITSPMHAQPSSRWSRCFAPRDSIGDDERTSWCVVSGNNSLRQPKLRVQGAADRRPGRACPQHGPKPTTTTQKAPAPGQKPSISTPSFHCFPPTSDLRSQTSDLRTQVQHTLRPSWIPTYEPHFIHRLRFGFDVATFLSHLARRTQHQTPPFRQHLNHHAAHGETPPTRRSLSDTPSCLPDLQIQRSPSPSYRRPRSSTHHDVVRSAHAIEHCI